MGCDDTLIETINLDVMSDNVWRYVFGRKIEHELQTSIKWIHAKKEIRGHVTSAEATEIISDAIDKSPNASLVRINRLKDMRIIYQTRDEGSNTRYYSLTPDSYLKMQLLAKFLSKVRQVIAAQCAAPNNPKAGDNLVPSEIYYNVMEKRYGQEINQDAA